MSDTSTGAESVAATARGATAERHRRTARALSWGELGERYGLVALLVAVTLVFAVSPETSANFLSASNIRTLLGNQAVTAILALAAIVPLVAGEFDVSIGATLGLSSMVAAKLMTEQGLPPVAAAAAATAVGATVGAVVGIIVGYLRVSSFVISLGMATLLGGVVTWYAKGLTVVGIPQPVLDFGNRNTLGVPRPVWLLVLTVLLLAYLLRYTIFGRTLLAIGVSRRAAELVGINSNIRIALAFLVSGTLAGAAGVVQLARTGSASAQVGPGFTLAALAAAFLGATAITPGRFNVLGTLVGVVFVGVTVNGLTLLGAADWVEPVFNGTAVIAAVSLSAIVARRKARLAA